MYFQNFTYLYLLISFQMNNKFNVLPWAQFHHPAQKWCSVSKLNGSFIA